ncbi:hypothetical protein M422DRAFT_27735 [Sphaerobolus stellatus SS14]|nr:hypothetical protein M422DRAFT_27735 [Sphaerobolus stellatus SS14]
MTEPTPRSRRWAPRDPAAIVVPGVDTAASLNDQIDQIDQLITIRLQNIDANFSRIQSLIANKLLPAFKRYAEGTEPVREAAKFWKSFYEAAAQVRIPVSSDMSSLYEDSGEQEATRSFVEDKTPDNAAVQNDSFARGAISSTPLVRDPTTVTLPRDDDDSWTASIESPFERLGRQVKDLTIEDKIDYPSTSSAPSFSPLHGTYTGTLPHLPDQSSFSDSDTTIQSPPRPRKKDKSPLRKDVLRQNAALAAASDISTPGGVPRQTPRRDKTPKNPFLPPNSNSTRKWNGLVDLRQPSLASSKSKSKYPRTPEPPAHALYDSDSSDDLMPPGMSPPVTMQFALPNRLRSSPVKLGLTPARKAAERIGHDLIASAASKNTAGSRLLDLSHRHEQSVSSVAPSLPSLTRYTGRQPVESTSNSVSNVSYNLPASLSRERELFAPIQQQPPSEQPNASDTPDPTYALPNPRLLIADEGIPPSPSSDSDSSEHSESNPSAGFLFATQNNARAADDSYSSSQHSFSSDEGDDVDDAARVARHPLAHMFVGGHDGAGDDSFDDSFGQDDHNPNVLGADEDTVFGGRQVGQLPPEQRRLTLRHDALLDDTYTVSLNPLAQVEQSPTPYAASSNAFLGNQ